MSQGDVAVGLFDWDVQKAIFTPYFGLRKGSPLEWLLYREYGKSDWPTLHFEQPKLDIIGSFLFAFPKTKAGDFEEPGVG